MLLKIKIHPEVITKSDSVRVRFIKYLSSNIRQTLATFDLECAIMVKWDHLIVRAKCDSSLNQVFLQILTQIPGIQTILKIKKVEYKTLHELYEHVYKLNKDLLINKSFAVRVKRRGKTEFNSLEAERYIGGGLRQHITGSTVNLSKPQYTVNLEIDGNEAFLVEGVYKGLGGFPIGSQDQVISLISGGYDSAVSSFQMIRRGLKVHYLFFNLGGNEHLYHVKRIVRKLWQNYSASHDVKFINVDFYNIMTNISNYVVDGYTGVILKRMFYRVATAIAQQLKIDGIVTGEAIGQVSSQTLKNLKVIEQVTDLPILRPLCAYDKEEIIKISHQIGTGELSAQVQEFCGIMGRKPTIAADEEKLLAEEGKLDIEALVQNAISNATIETLRDLIKQDLIDTGETVLDYVTKLDIEHDVVIDVRDVEAFERSQYTWPAPLINIPFFNLPDRFTELDTNKRYVLFCTKGVLSRIQAINLIENGFKNVAVISKNFKLEQH